MFHCCSNGRRFTPRPEERCDSLPVSLHRIPFTPWVIVLAAMQATCVCRLRASAQTAYSGKKFCEAPVCLSCSFQCIASRICVHTGSRYPVERSFVVSLTLTRSDGRRCRVALPSLRPLHSPQSSVPRGSVIRSPLLSSSQAHFAFPFSRQPPSVRVFVSHHSLSYCLTRMSGGGRV